ncbi:hypothetical protein BDQ12DRAFT_674822 [Crucibulum laeve]|uniref:Uncharacterized protein n=1 Tax=Crucibulum laeve TaxID=68775 RepID=A0A5C3MD19_9AGAR|nr:hypothetical protein BDQ12DRAFT_674822 [Crucibulum laeve]
MTTLPSFVELMASLGLEQKPQVDKQSPSPSPSPSVSPRLVNGGAPSSPTRSKSSPSLRDLSVSRNRVARYSPYSPAVSFTRRGSLSSVSSSSSSEYDRSPTHHKFSSSPPPLSLRARRSGNKLSINVYGSNGDLPANMPISSYVRRKTPGASPTSPTFPREHRPESPATPPLPLGVPILPTLLPNSANSDCFPITPSSDIGMSCSVHDSKSSPEIIDGPLHTRHYRRHTGVRISTPPRSAEFGEHIFIRRHIVDTA